MKLKLIDKLQLTELASDTESLIRDLDNTVYIVRNYIPKDIIDTIKSFCLDFSNNTPATWHPCVDDCPDYHRIHHNYPGAYVKSIQHGYYFHTWNQNSRFFDHFQDIFNLKSSLTDNPSSVYLSNLPSDGPIARVVVHQYPPGGGGQEAHIDPVSPFAKIQTIIQASTPGEDYQTGGLYLRSEQFGLVNFDSITEKGDLILMSPGVVHGVAAVDTHKNLDWDNQQGRWIIMPIIINSDVSNDIYGKPKGLGNNE